MNAGVMKAAWRIALQAAGVWRGFALSLVLSLALSLPIAGCKEEPRVPHYSCDMEDTGQVLSGIWHIEATGTRSGCNDRRFEGEIEIDLAIPLDVRAQAQPTSRPTGESTRNTADAFVERIKRADYLLEVPDMPEDLELIYGSTTGSCVSFSLVEDLPGRDSLRYHFDGYIVSPNLVVGELEGDGPENCEVSGDFTLTVR